MRALLLGTDFMYNSAGALVPIEINTNLGMDRYPIEDYDSTFNLTDLTTFITANNFIKVSYIGALELLSHELKDLCVSLNILYEYFPVSEGKTIPYVEDTVDHLIIRSAYDLTAIVDEEYCKSKVNFLNLIKNETFGAQFAYMDENGVLVNNITIIRDNGNQPNFILKAVYPDYDKSNYPKLFKVSNQSELDIVLQNVTTDYHLVEFHYNSTKIYQNHMQVIRSFNMLFPPDLISITLGQYTRISSRNIDENSTFDVNTYELTYTDRNKYITSDGGINVPKLLDTDLVEMADGTFKSALDLQIGDLLKTINIPNINNSENILYEYSVTYEEFMSGTTCSTNAVVNKWRVDKLVDYITITFTDGTSWSDTLTSSYLIVRNEAVMFKYLDIDNEINGIKIGDNIILISSCDSEMVSTLKEIASVVTTRQFFGGWEITVENVHLFLTKSDDSESSYVAIEHNETCSVPCSQSICAKGSTCCYPTSLCKFAQLACFVGPVSSCPGAGYCCV